MGVSSLFAVHVLDKPYHFGVNWSTTLCKNKDVEHFFILNFENHEYNKLLLYNSENGDVAWCNKNKQNNSECVFCVFPKKKKKPVYLKKQQKIGFEISQVG